MILKSTSTFYESLPDILNELFVSYACCKLYVIEHLLAISIRLVELVAVIIGTLQILSLFEKPKVPASATAGRFFLG